MITSLCVYCGSRFGKNPDFRKLAQDLGKLMASNDIRLVYGGGNIGLMGVLAQTVLEAGGHVTGIIPEHLKNIEVGLVEATEFLVVPDMHTRKKSMFDKSDAFVVLPGGFGTLDEFVEVVTWSQLGLHKKPVILVNSNNYWVPLISLLEHMAEEKFANKASLDLFQVVEKLDDLLPSIKSRLEGMDSKENID